ncbi:MAG: hypothetical protein ABSG42_03515 [Nitrospirota bacterium]
MDSRGGSRAAFLIYVLVAIVLVYAAIMTLPVYMNYYSLDDEIGQQMRLAAINSDDIILGDIETKIKDLGLPIKPGDIYMKRGDDEGLTVKINWISRVDYGYGIKRDFRFEINDNSRAKRE